MDGHDRRKVGVRAEQHGLYETAQRRQVMRVGVQDVVQHECVMEIRAVRTERFGITVNPNSRRYMIANTMTALVLPLLNGWIARAWR